MIVAVVATTPTQTQVDVQIVADVQIAATATSAHVVGSHFGRIQMLGGQLKPQLLTLQVVHVNGKALVCKTRNASSTLAVHSMPICANWQSDHVESVVNAGSNPAVGTI